MTPSADRIVYFLEMSDNGENPGEMRLVTIQR